MDCGLATGAPTIAIRNAGDRDATCKPIGAGAVAAAVPALGAVPNRVAPNRAVPSRALAAAPIALL